MDTWVESGLNWLVEHGRPLFQAIRVPIDFILSSFETALVSTPAPFMLIILFLVAWQFSNLKLGVATVVSLTFIGLIGAWSGSHDHAFVGDDIGLLLPVDWFTHGDMARPQ